jgi:hypothetical protein
MILIVLALPILAVLVLIQRLDIRCLSKENADLHSRLKNIESLRKQ